jgi:hypothetical protein
MNWNGFAQIRDDRSYLHPPSRLDLLGCSGQSISATGNQ